MLELIATSLTLTMLILIAGTIYFGLTMLVALGTVMAAGGVQGHTRLRDRFAGLAMAVSSTWLIIVPFILLLA